jgi:biopolymer transport protein ExbD
MSATHRAGYRNRSARALYETHYGPNMTPMVDVVMVILIFFMASAAILGPEWFVGARLPKLDASAPEQTSPPLRLTLALARLPEDDRAVVTLRTGPGTTTSSSVGLDQLAQALLQARGTRPSESVVVIIDPAQSARYEDIIAAHVACQRAGLTKVGLGEPAPSTIPPPDGQLPNLP